MDKRILVVDDDQGIRSLLQSVLESEGYHVDTASDGYGAWEKLEQQSGTYSAVLLDMQMPHLDGLHLLRTLHQQEADRNSVLLAMSADRAVLQEAVRIGVGHVLEKPFHLEALLQTLSTCLREGPEPVQADTMTSSVLPTSAPAPAAALDEPPHLRIRAFGEPVVLRGDQPVVGWRMARALELFFYLLDAGRPVSKAQIIAALWPEAHEPIDHTFHNTIYYVRKAIGEACLVLAHTAYTLELASGSGEQAYYDVARFEACSARARELLARQDEAAAASALQEMIELYRGDYLLPFDSEWCSLRRESLRTAYLDAHLHLAQLAWHRAAFATCVEHCQQIVAIDPLREEAHAGLIRCYLRQGKRGLAVRQYLRCRETLQHELGIEPGPSIQRLYHHLSSAR